MQKDHREAADSSHRIVSVNVGLPRTIKYFQHMVETGIYKTPVTGPVMVRGVVNDPSSPESPSFITDYCTGESATNTLSFTTMLLGTSPDGKARAMSPPAGTKFFTTYIASLRDTDQDGYEPLIPVGGRIRQLNLWDKLPAPVKVILPILWIPFAIPVAVLAWVAFSLLLTLLWIVAVLLVASFFMYSIWNRVRGTNTRR